MASEVITKNDLTAILDKTLPTSYKFNVNTLICDKAYTTGTANTWVKSVASVTIPENGLYRIRASYSHSAVYGVAYASTSTVNVQALLILQENSTGASVEVVTWLPAGTWSFWTKCATASQSNNLIIWQINVTA